MHKDLEQKEDYINQPNCVEASDFQKLYESLQYEVDHNNELTLVLLRYGNNIKPLQEVVEPRDSTTKVSQGLVDMFSIEVGKLRKVNEMLNRLSDHLRETVGF